MPSISARQVTWNSLSWLAAPVAGLLCLPPVYVAYLACTAHPSVWTRLWTTRVPELLLNTFALAFSVAFGTLLLGVSLAWVVTRWDFPGRAFWEGALVLPLAMPTYVLAFIYSYLLGAGGPVEGAWQRLVGPEARLPSPHSYAGATLVMTLDTFPFVYVLARTALLNMNASYEEVAKACGASRPRILYRITLPLMRPAVVAGLSLVILYVVSDFGAVSLLRYQTLTYAVYQQLTGRYDQAAASILSLLLVVIALLFLYLERRSRHRSRFYQTTGRYRRRMPHPLSPLATILATLYVSAVWMASFGLPALLLIRWSWGALSSGAVDARFWAFAGNSVLLSGLAATVAMLLGFPLAYLATRRSTRLTQLSLQTAYAGYVLPGPVGALAWLAIVTNLMPFLLGSAVILVLAYVVHFLPAGLQALEPALEQVTPNLEEASRSLGLGLAATLRRITLPLAQGGMATAWVLMFLQSMKELPATLLLRPVGFDTLAVRVWLEASEEYYQLAAPSALLLVMMALPVIVLLEAQQRRAA